MLLVKSFSKKALCRDSVLAALTFLLYTNIFDYRTQ